MGLGCPREPMKLHVAALALVAGWLLVAPPHGNVKAPLAQWTTLPLKTFVKDRRTSSRPSRSRPQESTGQALFI
jgi:hypothetical protein